MKYLRIFLIFLYFSLCFLFKDNFEAHLAQDNINPSLSRHQITLQQNYHNDYVLSQSDNQEITNLLNNARNNIASNFKYNKLVFNYELKNCLKHLSCNNTLAFNFKHIIYTRAP